MMTGVKRGRRQNTDHKQKAQARAANGSTNRSTKQGASARHWLTKSLRHRILAEANKLGLTPSEYLRMAVTISESIRMGMPTDKSIDMKSIVKLIDSPLWGILVQSIGPTITGLLEQTPGDKDETAKAKSAKVNANNQPSSKPSSPAVQSPQPNHPLQPVRPPQNPDGQQPQIQQSPVRPDPRVGQQPQVAQPGLELPNGSYPGWPHPSEPQFFL